VVVDVGLTLGALQQMVEQNDDKNEEAHKRLRGDLRTAEDKIYDYERRLAALAMQITRLEQAPPPDVSSLRFPLPIVVAVAAGFITIGAGIYKAQADVQAFHAEFVNRMEKQQWEAASAASKSEAATINLKESLNKLDAQQKLQYAEFQQFRQDIARRLK
jgi:hypothetical protein